MENSSSAWTRCTRITGVLWAAATLQYLEHAGLISTPASVSFTAVSSFHSTDPCFLVPQTFPDKHLFKRRYRESSEALLNDGSSSMFRQHPESSWYTLHITHWWTHKSEKSPGFKSKSSCWTYANCSIYFAGIRQHFRTCDLGLPATDRNQYYKRGFKDIVKKYSKWDLINQEQTIRLLQWVNKDLFLDTSTVEYKEIINAIKDAKKKRRESLSRQKWVLTLNSYCSTCDWGNDKLKSLTSGDDSCSGFTFRFGGHEACGIWFKFWETFLFFRNIFAL